MIQKKRTLEKSEEKSNPEKMRKKPDSGYKNPVSKLGTYFKIDNITYMHEF